MLLDVDNLDLVLGILADEFLIDEFLGEGYIDGFLVALGSSDERLDQAGHERVALEVQPGIGLLGDAAGHLDDVGDGVAIDGALVVDDHEVLLAHGAVDVAVFDALFLQGGECLGDVLLCDAAAFLLHLEPGVLRQLKRRGNLERGHVLERFAVAELQLLNLRHDDRLELLLLECVGVAVGHEGALGFVSNLVAVGAHDVGQRGFAGAEPGQVCLPPKILGDGVKLGIHSLGIDFDAELFPAGGKVGYGDFHEILSV